MLTVVGYVVAAVLVVVVLYRHLGVLRRPVRPWGGVVVFLLPFPVLSLAGVFHSLVTGGWSQAGVHGVQKGVAGYGYASVWSFVVAAMYSEVAEETMAALLIVGLERRGMPVGRVFVAGAVLRMSYHLHMEVRVYVLVMVAGVMTYLYRRYRRVVPLMAAHALFDIGTVLWRPGVTLVCIVAVLVWGMTQDKSLTSSRPKRHSVTWGWW
ncbi:CPBP family intramembrane glutamic endopeptidase [Sphaerisporangium aureirubrum]|uniref:CPBP family intramembrane glutamic endopeptidase n=1 Tax=Sphaerisporangium aureirubrum TaxID=1544736 RepID=A0ABW1NFG6_9ACTN